MRRQPPIDEKTRRILGEVRRGLEALYGVRLRGVYVYGSYARGQQHRGSDLDVLVVLSDVEDVGAELHRMSDLGSSLSLKHDMTISFLPVSETDLAGRQSPFLMNIRREALRV